MTKRYEAAEAKQTNMGCVSQKRGTKPHIVPMAHMTTRKSRPKRPKSSSRTLVARTIMAMFAMMPAITIPHAPSLKRPSPNPHDAAALNDIAHTKPRQLVIATTVREGRYVTEGFWRAFCWTGLRWMAALPMRNSPVRHSIVSAVGILPLATMVPRGMTALETSEQHASSIKQKLCPWFRRMDASALNMFKKGNAEDAPSRIEPVTMPMSGIPMALSEYMNGKDRSNPALLNPRTSRRF